MTVAIDWSTVPEDVRETMKKSAEIIKFARPADTYHIAMLELYKLWLKGKVDTATECGREAIS